MNNLKNILSKVNKYSCPNYLNFHCHTTCSDGSMSPYELIKKAHEIKLQHLSITDHNSIEAYSIINNLTKNKLINKKHPTTIWSGIEITCLLKRCLVHVLGFGFDLNSDFIKPYIQGHSAIGEDLQAINVVKALHKAGGMAFLAHPARYRLSFKELIEEAILLDFDGAEAWYDYNHSEFWIPTPFICEEINNMLLLKNKLSCCGTDSHGFSLLGR